MLFTIDPPSKTQFKFLDSTKKYVGFGGARGGGKSWAVRTKAKLLALNYPGIRLLIVRRTYPELTNNHINQLRTELIGIATYNDKDKVLRFGNGSTINFAYCDNDKDLDRLQGTEYDVVFLDEATQLSEYQIKAITACVRGVNDFPKRVYMTCNPGGQGHQYIKRVFLDRKYEPGEDPDDYEFVASKVTDNKVLMESNPDYVKQLEALPPKLRKAWLDGDWNIFEGQFFEDFVDDPEHYDDHRWTHVINAFAIPASWEIYRAFDWGYNKPFACCYFAIDHDGVAYHFLEYYGCNGTPNEGLKRNPDEVFTSIADLEAQHPWLKGRKIHGVADPAIWDAQYGESIAETAAKHRIYFDKGDHKRLAGWMQFHYRLAFDSDGAAKFYVFKNCVNFIRTIPLLQYDKHKVEDIDTENEDHIADAARYFFMARPIIPKIEVPEAFGEDNPLHSVFGFNPGDLPKSAPRKPRIVFRGL